MTNTLNMENTKELSLEELQKVAGGDKYDELYDELCEFDDFVSNMKKICPDSKAVRSFL